MCFFAVGNECPGKSLLVPQKFPETFNDASFIERMDVLAQGYEPWESEFDSSGKCIKGCAYHGITLDAELDIMMEKTKRVLEELQEEEELEALAQTVVSSSGVKASSGTLGSAGIPLGWPINGEGVVTSHYGRRKHPITGEWHNHRGIDIAMAQGTQVFSTADGTVANVWKDAACGNGLVIKHLDGYETVFCHLDKVVVAQGANVSKGQYIALSGNTGRSTGPHLHYAIKKDGVYINPEPLMKK